MAFFAYVYPYLPSCCEEKQGWFLGTLLSKSLNYCVRACMCVCCIFYAVLHISIMQCSYADKQVNTVVKQRSMSRESNNYFNSKKKISMSSLPKFSPIPIFYNNLVMPLWCCCFLGQETSFLMWTWWPGVNWGSSLPININRYLCKLLKQVPTVIA